jgi:cell division protein FtsW
MIVGEDKENGGNKPENTLTENINEKEEAPGMAEKMEDRGEQFKALARAIGE